MLMLITPTHSDMNAFDTFDYIKKNIEYAQEQLMIADDMYTRTVWGNRLDALEDALNQLRMEVK